MPKYPSKKDLTELAETANIPALSVAYVNYAPSSESGRQITSITVGEKDLNKHGKASNNVKETTLFPASSLSKIVFTYLIIQLVKAKKFDVKKPLHSMLKNPRFLVNQQYPKELEKLTAKHVLSHTASLPNLSAASDYKSQLLFISGYKLGKDYCYSGEAFFYLQQVVEKEMQMDLQSLAKKYVFDPLEMKRSTFSPPNIDEKDIVNVHDEFGHSSAIESGPVDQNAAGSLLTTAEDFAKFLSAWFRDDHKLIKKSFEPKNSTDFPVCGLGWHIYKTQTGNIAYQYGENFNTRSFVALDINQKKAVVMLTNASNGMCVASELMSPVVNIPDVFKQHRYQQINEPGWIETQKGRIAEYNDNKEEAEKFFKEAFKKAPNDFSKENRLHWFLAVNNPKLKFEKFTQPLESFVVDVENDYKDKLEISINEGRLVVQRFGKNYQLKRVSENKFLPESDQDLSILFTKEQIEVTSINNDKYFFKRPQYYSSYQAIHQSLATNPSIKTEKSNQAVLNDEDENETFQQEKSVEKKDNNNREANNESSSQPPTSGPRNK